MTPWEEQIELADELTAEMRDEGYEVGVRDLLDLLAICGFKLKRLIPRDFDGAGVSITTHAYLQAGERDDDERPT